MAGGLCDPSVGVICGKHLVARLFSPSLMGVDSGMEVVTVTFGPPSVGVVSDGYVAAGPCRFSSAGVSLTLE